MAAAAHSSCFTLNVGLIGLLLAAAHLPPIVLCTASFSMELMQRDQPESPLHYMTSTASRADYHPLSYPYVNLHYLPPAYVAFIKVGQRDKLVKLVVYFSGFSWLLCSPCKGCYNTTEKLFNQRRSRSYDEYSCEAEECKTVNGSCDERGKCKITMNIPINGYVEGTAASDRMRITQSQNRHPNQLHNSTFGCIYKTVGNFHKGSIGMMGLGPTPLSFARQLRRYSYEDKFSYCLPGIPNDSSRLYLGSWPQMPGTVSTPMDTSDNVYRVTVETIEIESHEEHPIVPTSTMYVIDPNTRFTHVPRGALDLIIVAVKKLTPFPPIIPGKIGTIHELCFDVATGRRDDRMPNITFFLKNGAPFFLTVENAFEIVKEDVMCLTLLSTEQSGGKSIIGSFAQLKKRIGIDITRKTLSFRTEKCTRLL